MPPAPGRMPSLTSGSAMLQPGCAAVVAAQASSRPPPMATLCSAATTGLGEFSIARMTELRLGSCMARSVPNSLMSAPPENAAPAPVMTMDWTAASALAFAQTVHDALAGGEAQSVDGGWSS